MSVSARNHKCESSDWWVAYKLPQGAAPAADAHDGSPPATGYEYVFFDPKIVKHTETPAPPVLSHYTLNQKGGAFYNTVSQLYSERPSIGRILYDDEISGLGAKSGGGHCKGVMGFDMDGRTAFWMLHSTPRYPGSWRPDFPEFEVKYGQTFLCITLPDIATLESIAAVMTRQHEPWVYGVRLPDSLPAKSPLRDLAAEKFTPRDEPETLNFTSKKGDAFKLMAKNQKWGKDFWNQYVVDELGVNLNVETWRRGTLAGTTDDTGQQTVADALTIDLEPIGIHYEWPYTLDHAKWAISTEKEQPWICIGDINRDKSQAKRGGGAIAFEQAFLWEYLSKIERLETLKVEKKPKKSGNSKK